MITFSIKIVFKTFEPISQQCGLDMWKLGSHFQALPGTGGRTYQLTATGQSMSVMDALTVLTEAIVQNVLSHSGSNTVRITEVSAKAE